jgi:hypothetical protein
VQVRRDRNHASVIIWSACNEVECVTAGGANQTAKLMRDATKKWDTTRPFSANSWMNQPDNVKSLAPYLDVEGFSHGGIGMPTAATIHKENPGKAMVSSECCSCRSQRGEDFLNVTLGISYPHTSTQATCLASCMAKSYPYWRGNPKTTPDVGVVAGTLGVWTLFDYAGEPGPWPLVGDFNESLSARFPTRCMHRWKKKNGRETKCVSVRACVRGARVLHSIPVSLPCAD